ncbi:ribonuclease H-like domain-containing protein [Tanacetum coccineum]
MPDLEDTTEVQHTGIFGSAYDDDDLDTCNSPYADQVAGAEANFNNMAPSTVVSPIPTTRVHSIHPKDQIIRCQGTHNDRSALMVKAGLKNQKSCFRNKKDEKGIVVRNKARLVAQGYNQEEGINCDEVFAPVARIEAIRLFLAYASFMNFLMYQMDVKSTILYGTIEEDIYVSQPLAWYETLSTYLLDNGFYRGQIDKTLFIKRVKGDILLDQYVGEILKKFGFSSIRTAITHMETNKALTKDENGEDVDVCLYRALEPNAGCLILDSNFMLTKQRTNKDTKLPQTSVPQDLRADEVVHKEGGMDTGGSPRRQDTMGGAPAQTRSERVLEKPTIHLLIMVTHLEVGRAVWNNVELMDNVLPTLYDSPLSGGNIPRSDKGRMELIKELMETCTSLTKGVLALEEAKTAQDRIVLLRPEVSVCYSIYIILHSKSLDDEDVMWLWLKLWIKHEGNDLKDKEEREREQFTIEERAQFLVETIAAQRKFRAAQRAAEIRSKPPTKTQLRNLMMTYLKNTGGYKHSQLKGKTYEEIHELYERQQKRNQDFIPMDSEKEAQKSGKRLKRVAGSYATQKSPKKPKVMKSVKNVTEEEAAEYEKEKEELRLSLKIISGDDSEVNYEPLSRRFPIVNWEYKLLGNVDAKDMYVYKLTRADGSSSYHGDMQAFLRRLDRQDLNDLYRLVQERFQDHPLEGHDLLLWGDLRMLFDPDEKDELWMNQLDWKLLKWKLYESCGVHTLFMDGTPMEINMLVEKKYPLIKELLEKMLNLQLEAEEESTMAFELIKFIKSMLEE